MKIGLSLRSWFVSSTAVLAACSSTMDVIGQDPTSESGGSSSSASTTSTSSTTGPATTEGPTSGGTTEVVTGTATEAMTTGIQSTGTTDVSTSGTGSSGSSGSTAGPGSSGSTGDPPPPDTDGDGIPDPDDKCPDVPDPNQEDTDGDGMGDACDDDDDDDTVPDGMDNCPLDPNTMQEDADKDMMGDACDDDDDGDGDPDNMDNCPLVPNPDQKDSDGDGLGDLCDDDLDGDKIPNPDDIFPNDPNLPGVVKPFFIYAHSASVLHTVDVMTYQTAPVGGFKFSNDGCDHSVTDVAIDRWGVLYGITFGCAYVIHPMTAQAYKLGTLPQSFNGLTMVPKGIIDPNKDTLIGISNAGGWYKLTLMNGVFQAQLLGTYGAGYTSAGDAFSIEGVGTYAAVNKQGVNNATVIVTVDPANGKVLGELATLVGYPTVYGLAGWENLIIAFNSSGDMIKVDPMTKAVTPLGNKGVVWWGAGVGTVLPQ